MASKKTLRIGSKVQYEGEAWKVDAINDANLQLRSSQGKITIIAIASLVGALGFAFLDDDQKNDSDVANFPDNVHPVALGAAQELLEHLNEMETGYKSGFEGSALDVEPRPQFDVEETTLNGRVASKAIELGMTARTLWNYKNAYKASGIYGLVDQRNVRASSSKIDSRILDALHEVIHDLINAPNLTKEAIVRRIKKKVKLQHPEADITLPSRATMNRLIDRETKNKGLNGSAKARRSIHNGPATTYRRLYATRPGEMLLVDSTPLDAFAMDPVSFKWLPVQLTIAMDLFSRSIVGWRFTPVSTKGVDAALLLYDVVRPKAMLKGWPEHSRWNYVGVPEHIVVELTAAEYDSGIAGVPFVHPDSIVVDHGKVFISQAFKDACIRLGTNLQLARPYTPTDKSHVERVFLTIRQKFVMELPGYKGPDVYSRGLDAEGEAFYFLDEIEEKFAAWVAGWWQCRHHDGLDLPGLPQFNMCPNEVYQEGISRAGFVHVVSTENLYFELLPTVWRTIQHYGVEFRGIRYDEDVLNDFRNRTSPYTGIHKGKWPIRYDPRDLSVAYFYDHEAASWHELTWCHSEGKDRPFNETVLGYAKALLLTRQGNVNNAEELGATLNSLLDNMHVSDSDRKTRRMIAVNAIHAELARKDRQTKREPESVSERNGSPDVGVQFGANRYPAAFDSQEALQLRILDVDEALENDDDDLGY